MPNSHNPHSANEIRKPGPKPVFTERMQLQVTKEQWVWFQTMADVLGVSISAVVRQGMDDLIERVERDLDAEEG